MTCKCVDRQRWIVQKLCKTGLTALCKRAMRRLAVLEELHPS